MRVLFILVFMVILASLVSGEGVSFVPLQESFVAEGTAQVEVEVNVSLVKELSLVNIEMRDGTGARVPVSLFLTRVNEGSYLIFFDLVGVAPGSYTLLVKDALYREEGMLRKGSWNVSFSVVASGGGVFRVAPGGVMVEDVHSGFSVRVRNGDVPAEVVVEASPAVVHVYKVPVVLSPFAEKTLMFALNVSERVNRTEVRLRGGGVAYAIPVWVRRTVKGPTMEGRPFRWVSNISKVEKVISEEEYVEGDLVLENLLKEKIVVDVSIVGAAERVTEVSFARREVLPGEQVRLTVMVNKDKRGVGEFVGEVVVRSGVFEERVPIRVTVTETKEQEAIIPDKKEPPVVEVPAEKREEKELVSEDDFLVFNFSDVAEEERSGGVRRTTLVIFVFLLVLGGITVYLSRKRMVRRRGFSELVKEAERRR